MDRGHADRRSRAVSWACCLGLGVLLAAACGGDGGAEQSQSTPQSPEVQADVAAGETNPCALVTSAEAGAALGAPAGEGERPPEANIPPVLSTCRYTAPSGQGVSVLSVMLRMGSSASESRIGFESAQEQFDQAQPVAGLGDSAFVAGDQLHVLRGNAYLIVAGDVSPDAAQGLAQSALTRLE